MDKVHEPENRTWISDPVKPAEILEKYKERVCKYKPIKHLNKNSERSKHLQKMVGAEDPETFEKLEEAMSIDNLTTEGEAPPMQVTNPNWGGGLAGLGVPKFAETAIPEEGKEMLDTLKHQAIFLERKQKNKKAMRDRRREIVEQSEAYYMSQPPPMQFNQYMTDSQRLYVIRLYRPILHPGIAYTNCAHKELTCDREIWMLGGNTLTELREMIICPNDNNYVGTQQVDTINSLAPRAGDVYKSCFFYIGDTFYNDTRYMDNVDYSETIIQWARKANRGIGPFKKAVMQDTKMDDLEFRIGQPYVFCHQGNHEHLLVFNDVRLVGPEDPQTETKYPLLRSLGFQHSRTCMVCQIKIATWVTLNNPRVPENPYFFCTLCYKSFNLKKDGTKVAEFEEYRYHDVNCV